MDRSDAVHANLTTANLVRCSAAGTNRIPQDVTQNHEPMFIELNRKALKPILPDMAAGPVMFVIAAHGACQQSLDELTSMPSGELCATYSESGL